MFKNEYYTMYTTVILPDTWQKFRTGQLCVGGYFFNTTYVKGNRRYMTCSKFKKLGCRSRAVLPVGLPPSKTVVFSAHNHPQDKNEKDMWEFLNQLKVACTSGMNLSMKSIYDSVSRIFPDGAKLKSYKSVRSSMMRWKKQE